MIINENFIFIRIPRTASSSMEKFLKSYHDESFNRVFEHVSISDTIDKDLRLKHFTMKDIINCNDKTVYQNKFKFAFVRNPFDRIVSYYHYYKNKDKLHIHSFNSFIERFIVYNEKLPRNIWLDQHMWLTDRYNKIIIVDFIGKFENLHLDFNKACILANIEIAKLPWLKKSESRLHYRKYYNEETKQIIQDRCKKDLKLFRYEF